MLVAEHSILVVGGVLVVLLIMLVAAGLSLAARLLGFLARLFTGTSRSAPARHWPARVCSHRGCAHVNSPSARYCGRCGRPLVAHEDVDAYG